MQISFIMFASLCGLAEKENEFKSPYDIQGGPKHAQKVPVKQTGESTSSITFRSLRNQSERSCQRIGRDVPFVGYASGSFGGFAD